MRMRLWKQGLCTAAAIVCLAGAASGQVRISQVYSGAGCGSPGCSAFNNDYVELYNAGAVAVDLSTYSLQYQGAGTSGAFGNRHNLTGSIAPGGYFLVHESGNANGVGPLPAADATGTLAMSATAGKVALATIQTAISGCADAAVVDLVGWGTANCAEGSAAPSPGGNSNALFRADGGCIDSGNNASDFSAATAAPRNSASPTLTCSSSTPPSGIGSTSPSSQCPGFDVLLMVAVTPGANPAATIASVTANLTDIGGAPGQTMFDNATNGDVTAGDGIYSLNATISPLTAPGNRNVSVTIVDNAVPQRTGNASITVVVNNCALRATNGTGASPNAVCNGEQALLTVNVTPGSMPDSTGITVTADLSGFFLSDTQALTDNGNNNFTYLLTMPLAQFPTTNVIPFTILDTQMRRYDGTITLTNVNCVQTTTGVVISQVYGGGGNSGAPLQNDFVELFNRTGAPIDLTGWSVQYANSTAAEGFTQQTMLSGTIPAFGYFLVSQAAGNSCSGLPCGDPLPVTADVVGAIPVSSTASRIALVNDSVLIGANCASTTIVDLVGSGGASCFEGVGAAGTLSNTLANYRRLNGCSDTDNNIVDFFTATPLPRNSASPINNCSGAATGACCATDGGCSITTMAGCSAGYQGDGSSCTPNNCPQPTGACCATDGGCTVTTSAGCSGTYQGNGTACSPNPCPVPTGACCLTGGGCSQTTAANCALANGTFQGTGTTCTPDPCAPATGACCCGASCQITTAAACVGANRTYSGNGSACTPFSLTVPCCRGNYNKSAPGPGAPGGISVQDIFDFLTGYFSNDPCANTNDSAPGPGAPNGVSVQDIFDFLAAYFGGC
ncbi:MAG: lamin tail domain-containing protein [Phycisphaerales bacterium]|nr:lamin tail domain-containing protein [Phycisphaerales bacterium]